MFKFVIGALVVFALVGYEIVTPDDIQSAGNYTIDKLDEVIDKTVDKDIF